MVRKDNSYCLQVRNISGDEELLTLYEHLDFWWGPCCLSFLVFCVMCFYLCYFVLCSVPSVTCVSGLSILDYKSFFLSFHNKTYIWYDTEKCLSLSTDCYISAILKTRASLKTISHDCMYV